MYGQNTCFTSWFSSIVQNSQWLSYRSFPLYLTSTRNSPSARGFSGYKNEIMNHIEFYKIASIHVIWRRNVEEWLAIKDTYSNIYISNRFWLNSSFIYVKSCLLCIFIYQILCQNDYVILSNTSTNSIDKIWKQPCAFWILDTPWLLLFMTVWHNMAISIHNCETVCIVKYGCLIFLAQWWYIRSINDKFEYRMGLLFWLALNVDFVSTFRHFQGERKIEIYIS